MQLIEGASLTAAEAAALLGVKAQTLYAYASRGLVRRVGDGKRRRYLVEDLERLRARQRARSGHGPVAAGALAFGEPVLDTSLSTIDERGPLYRGRPAVELARAGTSFESVAELLWTGKLPEAAAAWELGVLPRFSRDEVASIEDLLLALPPIVQGAPERHSRAPEVELALARRTIARVAAQVTRTPARAGSIAQRFATLTKAPRVIAEPALNAALVLLADHELNASSFAARIAASTDASLPACLLAALATLSGPRHGGASERVEALLDEALRLKRPTQVLELRLRRGDSIPGFGHPLYRTGDPRAAALLELARGLVAGRAPQRARLAPILALAQTMAKQGLAANVDYGLVALRRALGGPPHLAAMLFAVARSAGWVAHVLEQRSSSAVLRPRARYRPSPAP
ncbi:MAG: helix-turn-helix domain-containing protein [Myxococcales bacterium]|nr:MAG: helix-turn-helix domain-containing protein [Myxococcales bacterium]